MKKRFKSYDCIVIEKSTVEENNLNRDGEEKIKSENVWRAKWRDWKNQNAAQWIRKCTLGMQFYVITRFAYPQKRNKLSSKKKKKKRNFAHDLRKSSYCTSLQQHTFNATKFTKAIRTVSKLIMLITTLLSFEFCACVAFGSGIWKFLSAFEHFLRWMSLVWCSWKRLVFFPRQLESER